MRDIGYTVILTDEESTGFMYVTNGGGKIAPSQGSNGNPVEMIVVDSVRHVAYAVAPIGDGQAWGESQCFTKHDGGSVELQA